MDEYSDAPGFWSIILYGAMLGAGAVFVIAIVMDAHEQNVRRIARDEFDRGLIRAVACPEQHS